MKRLLTLVLALAMVLSLAACGSKKPVQLTADGGAVVVLSADANSGVVEPGLTTVRFYQKQVGVEAARMLLQMLEHPENGGPVRQTTLGYSVVDRGSIRIKEDA